jgi:hypothetical protein
MVGSRCRCGEMLAREAMRGPLSSDSKGDTGVTTSAHWAADAQRKFGAGARLASRRPHHKLLGCGAAVDCDNWARANCLSLQQKQPHLVDVLGGHSLNVFGKLDTLRATGGAPIAIAPGAHVPSPR